MATTAAASADIISSIPFFSITIALVRARLQVTRALANTLPNKEVDSSSNMRTSEEALRGGQF